jgi:copper homeostasis protein
MKLEVIATSLSDLKQINQSQADRIEYCVNLEVGGLTPTHQEILAFLDQAKLPVNVMVRPTSRDFYYTESEFQQMLRDVKFLSQTSANGIVVGILDYDDTIDFERMQAIMELKGDKEVTFHRAFE